jgi:hypothetical protein
MGNFMKMAMLLFTIGLCALVAVPLDVVNVIK